MDNHPLFRESFECYGKCSRVVEETSAMHHEIIGPIVGVEPSSKSVFRRGFHRRGGFYFGGASIGEGLLLKRGFYFMKYGIRPHLRGLMSLRRQPFFLMGDISADDGRGFEESGHR